MYTLKIQPVFQPMQTTLFKRAHTGACMDNGYDMSALEALSAFFQINNLRRNEQTGENNLVTQKDSIDMNTQLPAITNQICENLKTANNTNNLALVNNTTDKNLFDKYALSYYQQLKLQNEMPANFFTQNSASLQIARALELASAVKNAEFNQQSTKNNQRVVKRQKTIPDPLKLVYSNLNLNNEQVQPLDLSLKSASSTNSEHFILEPINLSRSNSPQDIEKFNSEKLSNDTQYNSLVQIQNAYCKKKKIMAQQAELLKQSSSSSPSSSPTSSPFNQKFVLEASPINLETCLVNKNNSTIATSTNNSTNKKRKLDESNLDSTIQHNIIGTNTHYKLKAKRRINKSKINDSFSHDSQIESVNNSNSANSSNLPNLSNGQAGTIIINAKNTFTCLICGEMFAFKDRLSKHIKSKHRPKTPEESTIPRASEESLPSSSLQQPTSGRSSPNQKSYTCKTCNRNFGRSDMLTRHSRTHSGEKPYTCETCGTNFTRSDHLATHKRTHSGEKPYLCSLCDYKACRRDMITRHMKTHSVKNKSTGSVLLTNNRCSNSNSSNSVNSFSPQASNLSENNSIEPKTESRSESESSEEEKNTN